MPIDRKAATALLAIFTVAGCTPNDLTIGAAVHNTNAAQIVDPEPKYEGDQVADGSQVAGAQERYRKGEVKKPVGIKTTSGGGSRGGQGGSSGGN